MFGQGKIEKYVMRKAFDRPEDPYLPENILWRQKEQFSDGVGYSWIDSPPSMSFLYLLRYLNLVVFLGLLAHTEKHVSNADFEKRAERFPVDTPATKVLCLKIFPILISFFELKCWVVSLL
jgi:asparagine synthase (glutamine-hydrolysing)